MEIRTYRAGDGDRLRTFWLTCGIKIRPGDDDASLARFAAHNPGLLLLAEEDGHLVGSALAGWDGRRGWLYHVAVHRDERRRGIGRTLVLEVERRLRDLGCPKLNLIVWDDNTWAMRFWEALGYRREKTVEYAKDL
ncbi:MAG TPA: GNAT family N-acetyltransferase [Candidatus Limnocylindria bacterium]|nr:GNAT family N-acetyltransferase [Candidatus Limnocylindria bacterium]